MLFAWFVESKKQKTERGADSAEGLTLLRRQSSATLGSPAPNLGCPTCGGIRPADEQLLADKRGEGQRQRFV